MMSHLLEPITWPTFQLVGQCDMRDTRVWSELWLYHKTHGPSVLFMATSRIEVNKRCRGTNLHPHAMYVGPEILLVVPLQV